MEVDLITKADLLLFKKEILLLIEQLLNSRLVPNVANLEGYDTKHTRLLLKCGNNKLAALRIQGKLRRKKVGGRYLYSKEDIHKLVNEGF